MEEIKETSFNKSNLILLIKDFTKKEMKELEKFIFSPFHNNRNDVIRFFLELKKNYPAFKDISRKKIFLSLYPGKKYRDDVIRRLSSNLYMLCGEYGAYKMYRREQFEHNRYLLEFHLSKNIDPVFLKHQKKAEAFLESQDLRDAKYFLNVNFLEECKRSYLLKTDSLHKKINLQKQIDSVWKYSIITLLRLYKIAIGGTTQFNKKYNLEHLVPLLKIIDNSDFINSKAVEIWYYVIKFHTGSRSNETFYKLKELLKKNSHIFDPVESFIIYVSLLGYCYDMNILPDSNFHKEEFEIIFQMLKEDQLTQGETIYSEWFMYAFLSAVRAGEIRFAEKFLEDYRLKIPHKERDNVVNQAYAEIAIEKRDFESALKYLSVSRYNNVSEKLRVNQMYLKIYYELELSEQFFYTVDSFRHLINDEVSLSRDIKQIRKNFINFTAGLFKIRLNESNITLKKLKEEIMNSKILGNKWLLAKVRELETVRKKTLRTVS